LKFTDKIAAYIVEKELNLQHLYIILPSERAKKYIAASLFHVLNKPFVAPKMITIDQWIKALSAQTVIDKTRCLIRLFTVHLQHAKTKEDRSFDDFLTWGTLLLSDFDELDRYLLNSKELFKNLADIKEIENWSFGHENLTDSQKRFMEFWDRLPAYYRSLNESLSREEVCYIGKAYRYVAENIDLVFKEDEEAQYLFAGFNALSPAETSIIKQLVQRKRGHVLIDADLFYWHTESHEAGRFLRDLKFSLGVKEQPFLQNTLLVSEKQIEIIECPQTAGQVKVAGTILEEMSKEEISQTLVLLADETLIVPLLRNLPKKIGQANITLGLPLRNTALRSWVEILFGIQENKQRFRSEGIYFNDLQKLWNHPFISAIFSLEEKARIIQLEHEIIQRNSIFISQDKIRIGLTGDRLMQLIYQPWKENWQKGLTSIRQLNNEIYSQLSKEFEFEKAILQGFDNALVDFENIISEGVPPMNLRSFKSLFNLHWSMKNISYHGNPMEGLQIMGLLETRLLDFETIICLGMNEGTMPPTNPILTMIPMDLRRYFGLPSPREKQGLFAHHFYRLLHAAKRMHITYTSAQEKVGSNEASRYLLQLELELGRLNPQFKITKRYYTIPQKIGKKSIHTVPKTPEIITRMDELFAHSTSASMLKKFTSCPLDFYYQYVMEFGEEEKVEEEVENNTFGTFIHAALEELYQPFARFNKKGEVAQPAPPAITSFDVEVMLQHAESEIRKQFLKHFNDDVEAFNQGKNLLSFKMAVELTERFLKKEKEFLSQQKEPVFIESLERELRTVLEVEIFGEKKKISLKGSVDRIDTIGGHYRIIDYKSGKVHAGDTQTSKNKMDLLGLLHNCFDKKYVLQLLIYCYLFKQNFDALPKEAIIISFISLNDGPFALETGNLTLDQVMDQFPLVLQSILEKIYDSKVDFEHNSKAFNSFCSYC
jgi:ATP-dependent helicase/nuclease subunit B